MTAQYALRQEAEDFDRRIEQLTREIEDLELRIVGARGKRADMQFHRAEALAAAQVLDSINFRVTRDPVITVHVDPPVAAPIPEE